MIHPKKRGRRPTMETRQKLAMDILISAAYEEALVMAGITPPRGKNSMARSYKALQREAAKKAGKSLRWAQTAWKQCRDDALLELSNRMDSRMKLPELENVIRSRALAGILPDEVLVAEQARAENISSW